MKSGFVVCRKGHSVAVLTNSLLALAVLVCGQVVEALGTQRNAWNAKTAFSFNFSTANGQHQLRSVTVVGLTWLES